MTSTGYVLEGMAEVSTCVEDRLREAPGYACTPPPRTAASTRSAVPRPPAPHHSPTFGISLQGAFGGKASPS
jgi:hypothetical protein